MGFFDENDEMDRFFERIALDQSVQLKRQLRSAVSLRDRYERMAKVEDRPTPFAIERTFEELDPPTIVRGTD